MNESHPRGFDFPCQFPIKAMGKTQSEFDLLVIDIIRQHVNPLPLEAIKTRTSKKGQFISVTVTIEATSRQQLDAIYQQLKDHPLVLMTL